MTLEQLTSPCLLNQCVYQDQCDLSCRAGESRSDIEYRKVASYNILFSTPCAYFDKLITFDLDDTLWDNVPTITRAEIDTRKWIENKVGKTLKH